MKKAVAAIAWLFMSSSLDAGAPSPSSLPPAEAASMEQRIDAMTADQRIGQLLLVGFEGRRLNGRLREMVLQRGVGGVVFYRSNIVSASQARELIRRIEFLEPDIAPFIAIDYEGGVVSRFSNDSACRAEKPQCRCSRLQVEVAICAAVLQQERGWICS